MTTHENKTYEEIDDEAKQNLVGFFDLLLQIDKRLNPQDYTNYSENVDEINQTKNDEKCKVISNSLVDKLVDKDGQRVYTENIVLNKQKHG